MRAEKIQLLQVLYSFQAISKLGGQGIWLPVRISNQKSHNTKIDNKISEPEKTVPGTTIRPWLPLLPD